MAVSNNITACINFLVLLCTIPIAATGLWLASRHGGEDCFRLFRWPVAILGALLLLVALAGFAGACWNRRGLLACYLFAMAALVTLLLALLVFAFAVAHGDGAYPVLGRAYDDYRLQGYSSWLRGYVADDPQRWERIRACVAASGTCRKLAADSSFIVPEQFYMSHLSPIEGQRSTSTCGADKGGNQYWGEVVESYNKNTPPLRKRNLKQCKDRWHKINRWTDLFECAYVKARRLFTSGYSDQMWIDAAHKFYVEDNKDAKLGPFVGIEVWKICRKVAKWKTYNEELRNARKRKSFHLEEERDQENDESLEEMPNRPMGQKAAKKAALAAKGKSKGSSSEDNGNSKESAIDLDKLGKFQEETNANRMKILELQQKLSSEKLETAKLAHLTAQETKKGKMLEKESKMMEAYNSLILQDTSSMSDVEKAERVAAMKCLRKALFPESD